MSLQTLPAVSSNVSSGSKSLKSKNWPIKLPRSKKNHSSSSFSSSTAGANKQGTVHQHSLDVPPPRPPPPLSRKGSTANDRISQELPLHTDETLSPPPMDSQTVRSTVVIQTLFGF
jgi:hypothetical protein